MSGSLALDPRTMPRLIVPPMDTEPWPTLGPFVVDWIVEHLVHGPGDILGQPIEDMLEELQLFIYRAYEVYPRGHELEGRRRFKRVVLSRRKGFAKTELMALLGIAEMDPAAPVRCDGYRVLDGEWVPSGRPVLDPYIPMVATTEEQSEDLAYGAAKAILENCDLGNSYDIGWERIMHRDAPGVMKALASAPSAREGARTTFQGKDETHLWTSDRLRGASVTMDRNIYTKRPESDPWGLETTTMYAPGEESVAEMTHEYALSVLRGEIDEATLYFDHRQASELHDLDTKSGLIAAIEEASGDAIAYTDVRSQIALFNDPNGDPNDFRRYALNQRRRKSTRWLSEGVFDALSHAVVYGGERRVLEDIAADTPIVLAFDGSYSRDSTALVGVTIGDAIEFPDQDELDGSELDEDGSEPDGDPGPRQPRVLDLPEDISLPHVFVIRSWERPANDSLWRTPRLDVMSMVEWAMEHFDVREFCPDPPGWGREVEHWEQTYGDVVVRFETNQPTRMGPACDKVENAAKDQLFTHDGNERLAVHVGNCVVKQRGRWRLIDKPGGQDSPDKIDLAVGMVTGLDRAYWHAANLAVDTPFAFA